MKRNEMTEEESVLDAHIVKRGYKDYLAGKKVNPYRRMFQLIQYNSWRKGYNEAKSQFEEPEKSYNFKSAVF